MCDIKTKTDLKERIIYKVVIKKDDKYYGLYSGVELKLGKVSKKRDENSINTRAIHFEPYSQYNEPYYNALMIGRINGFANKIIAKNLAIYNDDPFRRVVTTKVVLSGSIYRGTGKNISYSVPVKCITYAGSIVKSFEEV
jgi:hypothetical protein